MPCLNWVFEHSTRLHTCIWTNWFDTLGGFFKKQIYHSSLNFNIKHYILYLSNISVFQLEWTRVGICGNCCIFFSYSWSTDKRLRYNCHPCKKKRTKNKSYSKNLFRTHARTDRSLRHTRRAWQLRFTLIHST